MRVVGKELTDVRLFQVHIGRDREGHTGQRCLAHLAGAEDKHGGKLAGEAAQTGGMQAIPHAPHFGSIASKIKANLSKAKRAETKAKF